MYERTFIHLQSYLSKRISNMSFINLDIFDFPELRDASIPEFRTQQIGISLPQFDNLVRMTTPMAGSYRAVSHRSSDEDDLPPFPLLDVSTYEGLSSDFPSPPSFVRMPEEQIFWPEPIAPSRLRDFRPNLSMSSTGSISPAGVVPETVEPVAPETVEPVAPVGLRNLRLPESFSPVLLPESPTPLLSWQETSGGATPADISSPAAEEDAIQMAEDPIPNSPVADDRIPLNQTPWRIITGYKAKQKLSFGNYLFVKNKQCPNTDKIYWTCEERGCRARIHTLRDAIVKIVSNDHCHEAVPGKAEAEEALNYMKLRAATTAEDIRHIIHTGRAMIGVHLHHYIPKGPSLVRCLNLVRSNAGNRQVARTTIEGEAFLRYEDDNMLIFAADSDLRFLAESLHWFGDGTFKVAPNDFYQQYTLHAYFQGKTYPCVYVLLKAKNEVTYTKMLDEILLLMPNDVFVDPSSIMTDFEKAAINAFKNQFPFVDISGCLFHLGQSVWRKIRDLKLDNRYRTDPEFAIRVRKFMALAFVPPHLVHEYMRLILQAESLLNDGLLKDFAKYFQDTYVGQEFIEATFVYTSWNMYQRLKYNLPRTNNTVEAWHGVFARETRAHPDRIALSDKYRTEQHSQAHDRADQMSGRTDPNRRARYTTYTNRLNRLIVFF